MLAFAFVGLAAGLSHGSLPSSINTFTLAQEAATRYTGPIQGPNDHGAAPLPIPVADDVSELEFIDTIDPIGAIPIGLPKAAQQIVDMAMTKKFATGLSIAEAELFQKIGESMTVAGKFMTMGAQSNANTFNTETNLQFFPLISKAQIEVVQLALLNPPAGSSTAFQTAFEQQLLAFASAAEVLAQSVKIRTAGRLTIGPTWLQTSPIWEKTAQTWLSEVAQQASVEHESAIVFAGMIFAALDDAISKFYVDLGNGMRLGYEGENIHQSHNGTANIGNAYTMLGKASLGLVENNAPDMFKYMKTLFDYQP